MYRARMDELAATLHGVQNALFNLGSLLATKLEDLHPQQPQVTIQDIELLERLIDRYNDELPALRSFVLPGGNRPNVELHMARTICRRAERICVRLSQEEPIGETAVPYLNRLSDALFVWSRWVIHQSGGLSICGLLTRPPRSTVLLRRRSMLSVCGLCISRAHVSSRSVR